MFSIETLAGCVTLDLTTNLLVVRSKVPLFNTSSSMCIAHAAAGVAVPHTHVLCIMSTLHLQMGVLMMHPILVMHDPMEHGIMHPNLVMHDPNLVMHDPMEHGIMHPNLVMHDPMTPVNRCHGIMHHPIPRIPVILVNPCDLTESPR